MLPGKVHHLGDLCFSDFIGVDAAFADAVVVHVQHDADRLFGRFVEIFPQYDHDKLLRGIVVVQQQNAIHAGFSGLRAGAGDERGAVAESTGRDCHVGGGAAEELAEVLAGDGDFLMNGQELATACQHAAKSIVVLLNNGMYSARNMSQLAVLHRTVLILSTCLHHTGLHLQKKNW